MSLAVLWRRSKAFSADERDLPGGVRQISGGACLAGVLTPPRACPSCSERLDLPTALGAGRQGRCESARGSSAELPRGLPQHLRHARHLDLRHARFRLMSQASAVASDLSAEPQRLWGGGEERRWRPLPPQGRCLFVSETWQARHLAKRSVCCEIPAAARKGNGRSPATGGGGAGVEIPNNHVQVPLLSQ